MFRKNRALAPVAIIAHAACWSGAAPTSTPLHNEAPRAAPAPSPPAPLAAQLGPVDEDGQIRAATEIPLYAGSPFGWRLYLQCTTHVAIREELHLPAPGDWGADPEMTIHDGGRLAVVQTTAECIDGWIEKQWRVSPHDPPGTWTLRVTAEGFSPHTFRARFVPSALP